MNNKSCVHLAIIGHSVTLDEILEAYNVGNSLLAVPDWILIAWNLAFLSDLQTPSLLVMVSALVAFVTSDVNFLLQHKSKVD